MRQRGTGGAASALQGYGARKESKEKPPPPGEGHGSWDNMAGTTGQEAHRAHAVKVVLPEVAPLVHQLGEGARDAG